MIRSNYVVRIVTTGYVLIKDIGPWDKHLSVTNDAEKVVEDLVPRLAGRKLFYIDSDNNRSEILIKDGKFAGFAPAIKEASHE